MFRFIIGVIVSIFMISLLRMIMTAISRELGGKGSTSASGGGKVPPQQQQQPPNISGGELRKCPECGSYHAVPNLAGRTAKGEVVYFCSAACREKHRAA